MKREIVGVIAAAGKGIRLRPRTDSTQKAMFRIGDAPVLERNIMIMRDQLGIRQVFILVGHLKEQITGHFGDGKRVGVDIKYVEVKDVEAGIARGVSDLAPFVSREFCLMLGDEVYQNSNHKDLLQFLDAEFSAVCAVKQVRNPQLIKKNYSITLEGSRISTLTEKPEVISNNYLGCGTFLFRPSVFEFIGRTPASSKSGRVEIVDVINLMAQDTGKVYPFFLEGGYVNVNSIDDYNSANYMVRAAEFDAKSISLVVPAYNEEYSIGLIIDSFKDLVDEIVVVDGNSSDATAAVAANAGAIVLSGGFNGYGGALKAGMEKARGDIIILVEADGSFFSRDLKKILEYLKDADMVVGTRTTKQMIEQAANMKSLLRIGNIVVAKLIEVLWLRAKAPRLTDVGCTYRGIWKSAFQEIRGSLHGVGPEFSPEMIIEVMRHNMRLIEIPITYSGRVAGRSKFSGSIFGVIKTAMKMLIMIFGKRLGWEFSK
jgi:NDP-sugar pyrophosphorylase family protein